MDKTEVLRILTGLDDTGAIAEVHFDMSELGERAEAIAQAAEEEKTLLEHRLMVAEDLAEEVEHNRAALKGQTAVISALAAECIGVSTTMLRGEAIRQLRMALSAAPRVLGTMTGRWRIEDGKTQVLTIGHLAPIHVAIQMGGELTDEDGQQAGVYVVECPRPPEQSVAEPRQPSGSAEARQQEE